jgi:ABC-2 type transport system ATP-binding protein
MTTQPRRVASGAPDSSTPDQIMSLQNVSKRFGQEYAVRGVSFTVPPGMIFGYIGPSGSGKSTTIRMLTGVYAPTEGGLTVLGSDPMRFTQSMRQRIGYMPQHFAMYPSLSVGQNLNFAASLYGLGFRRGKRLRELLDLVELRDDRRKPASRISGGMQRRLSLASTLVHNPELIFLDEPTAGIDPVLRLKFWEYFRALRDQGHTLFVTTQYVSETAYCDLVGMMNEGQLIALDTPDGLRKQALGGELVDVRTVAGFGHPAIVALRKLPCVRHAQRLDDRGVRFTVDEASTAMLAILQKLRQEGIEVESTEQYVPPFDDVFVALIRQGGKEAA